MQCHHETCYDKKFIEEKFDSRQYQDQHYEQKFRNHMILKPSHVNKVANLNSNNDNKNDNMVEDDIEMIN